MGRTTKRPRSGTGSRPGRPGPALIVLASAAVVAALAITGYVLFREEPWDESVIATIGETRVTEAEVDGVVDELRTVWEAEAREFADRLTGEPSQAERDSITAQRLADVEQRLVDSRERVIEMRILTEAGQDYADAHGLTVPAPDPAAAAEQAGLPQEHPYVRVAAEFLAVMATLQAEAAPVEPTEADQREVYDHLVAEDLTEASFAEARTVLTAEVLAAPVGVRDLLREVVAQAEVRVNPRYDPVYEVPVPMGEGGSSWLGLPLRPPGQEAR